MQLGNDHVVIFITALLLKPIINYQQQIRDPTLSLVNDILSCFSLVLCGMITMPAYFAPVISNKPG